jgi:hexosaminidase
VVSADHYTKAQIRDLIAFAAQHHITIIPEIDMPGHMTQILAAHPELHLVGADGLVEAGSLDLSQPQAYVLARDLLEEYLPLFPGPDWHLGADEWLSESQIGDFPQLDAYAKKQFGPNARARDAFFAFINWANGIVRGHGKTLRIWNDQLVTGYQVQVDTDVVIEYWYPSDFMPSENLYDAGNPLVNADWNSLYYVVGITHPDPGDIYGSFSPTRFADGFEGTPAGVEFSIWADVPPDLENEDEVAFGTAMPLRALAQVAWGSPKPITNFDDWVPTLDVIGHAPGYTGVDQPLIAVPSSSLPALAAYPLSNLVDGRPGTYFTPARSLRRGDEIILDFRTTTQIGEINVRMRADAAVQNAVIELSADKRKWHTAGQLSGQTEVHILLTSGGNARYARLRVLAAQSVRPAIGEFSITAVAAQAGALSTSLPAYQDNTLDLVNSGDPAKFFWSSRSAQTDDYVALDLGAVQAVHTVTLDMANPPGNVTDYVHHGVLEVSADGSAWTALSTFDNQSTISVQAPAGTTGRYLRLRATGGQGDWVIVRQFTTS